MPGHEDWYQLITEGDFKFIPSKKAKNIPFDQAAQIAARSIYQRYENLHVCLSGGNDSKFVADCFLNQGLDIGLIIIDCEMNREDVRRALDWCNGKGLKPSLFKISKEEYIRFAFEISWKRRIRYLWGFFPLIAEKFLPDAKLVTGYEDPFECDESGILKNEIVIEQGAFLLDSSHPSAVFAYTPEILLAMVRDID